MYDEEFEKITLKELISCLSPEGGKKVLEAVQESYDDVYNNGSNIEIDSQYQIILMAIKKYMQK